MPFDPRPVLAADFPDLSVRTVEELGEGWDHVAYLVNDDLVFRIPWAIVEGPETDEPEPDASVEIALLRHLAGRLSVDIPEPVLVAPRDRYFGYRHLPGCSADTTVGGPTPPGDAFVDAVVRVALEVEQLVPHERATKLGLPRHAFATEDLANARRALSCPRLTASMASVGELALTLLDSRYQRASARGLVTTHADFGLDHWLLDDTGRVHALIDWTDSCIAPAEITLAALMWHAPELAAASADRYEALRGVALDRCLIFAIGYCGALGDVVELIEEGDDEDGVEWCLHFLRTWSDPAVMATLDVREE